MKTILFFIIALFSPYILFADLKGDMLLNKPESGINTPSDVTEYFAFATDILLVAFPLIAIGVFLWVAYNLFTAQGNEEQFKKAWKSLVYVGVGIVVAMASYVLVKVVTNISL